MDAIELLCHDHRMVEQLFRDYRAAATDGQRRGVVEIIVRELSKHAALEELMFYPLEGGPAGWPQGDRRAPCRAPERQEDPPRLGRTFCR
jgi:hypothetical protein